jgi:hypothetical protein
MTGNRKTENRDQGSEKQSPGAADVSGLPAIRDDNFNP